MRTSSFLERGFAGVCWLRLGVCETSGPFFCCIVQGEKVAKQNCFSFISTKDMQKYGFVALICY